MAIVGQRYPTFRYGGAFQSLLGDDSCIFVCVPQDGVEDREAGPSSNAIGPLHTSIDDLEIDGNSSGGIIASFFFTIIDREDTAHCCGDGMI